MSAYKRTRIDLTAVDPTQVVDLDAGGAYDPAKYCVDSGVKLDTSGAWIDWKKEFVSPANFVSAYCLNENDSARNSYAYIDTTAWEIVWTDGTTLALPFASFSRGSSSLRYDSQGRLWGLLSDYSGTQAQLFVVKADRSGFEYSADIKGTVGSGTIYYVQLEHNSYTGDMYAVVQDRIVKINTSTFTIDANIAGAYGNPAIAEAYPSGIYVQAPYELRKYTQDLSSYTVAAKSASRYPYVLRDIHQQTTGWHHTFYGALRGILTTEYTSFLRPHDLFSTPSQYTTQYTQVVPTSDHSYAFVVGYDADATSTTLSAFRLDWRQKKRLILPVRTDAAPAMIRLTGTLPDQTRLYWRTGSDAQTDADTGWQYVDPDNPAITPDSQGWQLAIYLAHVPWLKGPDGVLIPHNSGSMQSPVITAVELYQPATTLQYYGGRARIRTRFRARQT